MINSETDNDEYFINIIQKTPYVEDLARQLNEKGFPSIDEVSAGAHFARHSLVIFHL
jgi:hypothetical protein